MGMDMEKEPEELVIHSPEEIFTMREYTEEEWQALEERCQQRLEEQNRLLDQMTPEERHQYWLDRVERYARQEASNYL